jgi:uncharacterized protein (TIGR03435 family)
MRFGLFVLALAALVPAQPQAVDRPEFDVASIKPPNPAGDRGTNMSTDGGTLKMHNAILRFCIVIAYGVQDYLIKDGPGWINTENFEITGKAGASARHDQLVAMLRTLLEDRFKLSVHRETKQQPVYALVLGKNGPKLRPSGSGGDGFPGRRGSRGPLVGEKASMPGLAATLSTLTGRKVLNQTGLTGVYDFTLEYAPAQVDSSLPSLVTALQPEAGVDQRTG